VPGRVARRDQGRTRGDGPRGAEDDKRRGDERRRRSPLVTGFGLFTAAVILLAAAVVAIAMAQFGGSHLAPWLSIGFAAGSVVFAIAAMAVRSR
jgi:hypothetical protein